MGFRFRSITDTRTDGLVLRVWGLGFRSITHPHTEAPRHTDADTQKQIQTPKET